MADRVVAYYYDEQTSEYSYNYIHPWRPIRSKLVHSLISGYGLPQQMVVHRPRASSYEQLTEFHADGEAPGDTRHRSAAQPPQSPSMRPCAARARTPLPAAQITSTCFKT